MTSSDNCGISSVCVLRLTALGDCINAFGFIGALKQKYPDIKITWIIDKRFSYLFIDENGKELVEMIPLDIKNRGIFHSYQDLKKALHGRRFDVLYNMQTSIKASLISLAVKAKCKYGYDDERSRELQSLFVNRKISPPSSPHVLSGFMSFASSSGLQIDTPSWDYSLSMEIKNKALELVNGKDSRIFLISPASAKQVKNWTAEGYIGIARHAIDNNFKIVLVGGKSPVETDLCSQIEKSLGGKCTNLCGKTSLRELAAVVSISDLVISPDSACMHLSSSLNVPVIGLFAIHNPDRVGAWNYRDIEVEVYKRISSEELGDKKASWRYRVKNPDAMKQIGIDSVIRAFDKACSTYGI